MSIKVWDFHRLFIYWINQPIITSFLDIFQWIDYSPLNHSSSPKQNSTSTVGSLLSTKKSLTVLSMDPTIRKECAPSKSSLKILLCSSTTIWLRQADQPREKIQQNKYSSWRSTSDSKTAKLQRWIRINLLYSATVSLFMI